jgi:uncharacterized protein (TIGR03118 family)
MRARFSVVVFAASSISLGLACSNSSSVVSGSRDASVRDVAPDVTVAMDVAVDVLSSSDGANDAPVLDVAIDVTVARDAAVDVLSSSDGANDASALDVAIDVSVARDAAIDVSATSDSVGDSASPDTMPSVYVVQTALLADQASASAAHVDPKLINPWGLTYGPQTYFWGANNGSGTSTVYDGTGALMPTPPLVVTIPPAAGGSQGSPTGLVSNSTTAFNGDKFIFASLDGTVSGWASGASATLRMDNSASGAAYTGLAIGNVGSANYLYAANFAAGTVDVLDASYAHSNLGSSAFKDPTLPAGYSPFNIQALGGLLYVAYAQHLPSINVGISGTGLGYVSVFNMNGSFAKRLVSQGWLDAPWGLALAPSGLAGFAGALLVGNFGDGRISAYDSGTGAPLGQLVDVSGTPVVIDGLWALAFGNGSKAGSTDLLYFTAGPQGGTHGLFGSFSFNQPGSADGGAGDQ